MYQDSQKKIICQKNENNDILLISNNNLNVLESIPTNNKEHLIKKREVINKFPNDKKIELNKVVKEEENDNNYRNNQEYKTAIKRIANTLKKRVKLPKCKLFKFYIAYRLLILKIVKGIKNNTKKLNFLEKLENNKTEQEINQIQKIDSNTFLEERKKMISKEIISYSDRKKNIKINLTLFTKNKKN